MARIVMTTEAGDAIIVVKTALVLHVGMTAIAIAVRDMVLVDAVAAVIAHGARILRITNVLDVAPAAATRTMKIVHAIALAAAVGYQIQTSLARAVVKSALQIVLARAVILAVTGIAIHVKYIIIPIIGGTAVGALAK